MATICRLTSKTKGTLHKAVIHRDQIVLATTTFARKFVDAAWARRIAAEAEKVAALGSPPPARPSPS
jgi:citrate lyase beta subunit